MSEGVTNPWITPLISDRDLRVLVLRFVEGWTYKKIGAVVRVTPERAREIAETAPTRLIQAYAPQHWELSRQLEENKRIAAESFR